MDDTEAAGTDMGMVVDVPSDPKILPDNLSYDEIGTFLRVQ